MKLINSIEVEKNKANDLYYKNKITEAKEYYTKLLEFDPENKNFMSKIYLNRALCIKIFKSE